MTDGSEELLELAIAAARSAGELLVDRFHGPASGVSSKTTATDLVSDADRDAEALIKELIGKARPNDAYLAEESGAEGSSSELTWIIDPLDGTVNFLFGIPAWTVSIAARDHTGMLVGVVHDPNRSETFTAARGAGAFLGGDRISVSDKGELSQALVGTGFAYDAIRRAAQAATVQRVLPQVRDIRRGGSAALDLAYLACGRLDGFYEAHMMQWDKAAGVLLIQEAGGVVADLADPGGEDDGVIASGPALHDALCALVLAQG